MWVSAIVSEPMPQKGRCKSAFHRPGSMVSEPSILPVFAGAPDAGHQSAQTPRSLRKVAIMKTASEADVGRLDPRNIIDIDLASDEMRQGARRGLLAEWATMAPFYVVNNGVPQVVVTRYADVKTVLTDQIGIAHV